MFSDLRWPLLPPAALDRTGLPGRGSLWLAGAALRNIKGRSAEVKCAGVQLSVREPRLSNQLSFILGTAALQNAIGLIKSPEPLAGRGPLIERPRILIERPGTNYG